MKQFIHFFYKVKGTSKHD